MEAEFLGFTRIQIATVPTEWNALFGHNRIPFEFCRMGHFLSHPPPSSISWPLSYLAAYTALPLSNYADTSRWRNKDNGQSQEPKKKERVANEEMRRSVLEALPIQYPIIKRAIFNIILLDNFIEDRRI